MTTEPARAGSGWLTLREAADAEARATDLVEMVHRCLPTTRPLEIHDLGCGTGAMARWLAPQLPGPQHGVVYDRDAELLALVHEDAPDVASEGLPVTVETRRRNITRLDPGTLDSASLITASALLDMMTGAELRRFVDTCARPGCVVLVTLTVVGRVDLTPCDPLDQRVMDAFNAHQRRAAGAGSLVGPDAVGAAVDGFTRRGRDVVVRPSAWQLGPRHGRLTAEWFSGWLSAACEQAPELVPLAPAYAERRLDQAAAGQLLVTVHHEDLLVRPSTGSGPSVDGVPDPGDAKIYEDSRHVVRYPAG